MAFYTPEKRAQIAEMYWSGISLAEIGRRLNITTTSVARVLSKDGIRERTTAEVEISDEDREAIARQYGAGYGLRWLAKKYGHSESFIRNVVFKAGVPLRSPGPRPLARALSPEQQRRVVDLYNEGQSRGAIGRIVGLTGPTIDRILRWNDIVPEKRIGRGPDNHKWTGGRSVNVHGYVLVWGDPDSPYREMYDKRGRVMEHRLVMAQQLGRPLAANEWVHHINGDKQDNRPENLQLRKERHGKGQRFVCLDCGSHNVAPAELA